MIEPLKIPDRFYGQPIPVAPDMNQVVDKVDEVIAAVNAGLATSNAIIGGDKYAHYLSSQTYGVPDAAMTLDRLDPATILPGNQATVINPHDTPLMATAVSTHYVATIVEAGAAGAVLVPAYLGATERVYIAWQQVVSADSFSVLLPAELDAGKQDYANLALRPLLIKMVNALGAASTIIKEPADTQPAPKPTVTGFLPGAAAVGESITIMGTGFIRAEAVTFNGTPASFRVINATTIVAVVPEGATTGKVGVSTATATGTSAADFTVGAKATSPTPTPTNSPPAVQVSVGGTATVPQFTAIAADADGIKSIFLKVFPAAGGAAVQTFGPSAPGDTSYVTSWPTASAGNYLVRAIATDQKDLTTTTDAEPFTVTAGSTTAPPTGIYTPTGDESATYTSATAA